MYARVKILTNCGEKYFNLVPLHSSHKICPNFTLITVDICSLLVYKVRVDFHSYNVENMAAAVNDLGTGRANDPGGREGKRILGHAHTKNRAKEDQQHL